MKKQLDKININFDLIIFFEIFKNSIIDNTLVIKRRETSTKLYLNIKKKNNNSTKDVIILFFMFFSII